MGLFGSKPKVYKPAVEVDLGPSSDEIYVKANVTAPRVAGFLVKVFVWILESWVFGPIGIYVLCRDNLIHKFVSYADIKEPPLFTSNHEWEDPKEQEISVVKPGLSPVEQVHEVIECLPSTPDPTVNGSTEIIRRRTIMDFSRAYSSKETTPLKVATKFLAALRESSGSNNRMSYFINSDVEDILRQATQSTKRYEEGTPISVLDGILIAVKDEIDCLPYPTTGGTKWLHKFRPCNDDASCVKSLRLCGAILVGKTNMHELGAGTSGINPHYGITRNPYDPGRVSGGSSSGSAAIVCAGLCPVAIGVDGGGSVRMPASLCGVVGLKPTCGRFSHDGVLPLNWTIGNVGVIAGTIEDAVIVYAALSKNLASQNLGIIQPKLNFPLLRSSSSLSNIKLAKYDKWFNDCNHDIRVCCDRALNLIQETFGWKIVDVTVPEIEEMRLAHYVTIGSECTTALAPHLDMLKFSEIGADVRLALRVYGSFSSKEYLNAQRLRNRQMYFHKKIFEKADVIVTPTTGVTAYAIQDDALECGELDYINGAALVRFAIAGNFLGLPALTVKVGYDDDKMPVGLQFIGKPWSEATLLHLGYAMQEVCRKMYRKPKVFFDMLKPE